ncbi:MAG TPA: hypothetical protein VGR07_21230, partial [Thermoanaerobaculia bacterium]|nr:hypothetical protein [Thermoanaerobaculia bacterium]
MPRRSAIVQRSAMPLFFNAMAELEEADDEVETPVDKKRVGQKFLRAISQISEGVFLSGGSAV